MHTCTPTPCSAATPPISRDFDLRRFGAQTMATFLAVMPVSPPRSDTRYRCRDRY